MSVDTQVPNQSNTGSEQQKMSPDQQKPETTMGQNNEPEKMNRDSAPEKVDMKKDEQEVIAEEKAREEALKQAQKEAGQAKEIGQVQSEGVKQAQEDMSKRFDETQQKINEQQEMQQQGGVSTQSLVGSEQTQAPVQNPEVKPENIEQPVQAQSSSEPSVSQKEDEKKGGFFGFFSKLFGGKKETDEPADESKKIVQEGNHAKMEAELTAKNPEDIKPTQKEEVGQNPEAK